MSMKLETNRLPSHFSYFLIFIAFLMSMRCWIGFENRSTIYFNILPILLMGLAVTGSFRFVHKNRYLIFSLLVYLSKMYVNIKTKGELDINGLVSQAIPSFTIYQILCIVDSKKDELIKYIVKWFGLIMIPGLIIYIITFVVPFPSFGIIKTHYAGDFYGPTCSNYLFYLRQTTGLSGMFRFNGPFIEPGDLGNTAAFLLLAANFDFKKYKYLWAVFAGLIASFSLSGYLLCAFGYALVMFSKGRISMQRLVTGTSVVLFLYAIGLNYNGGDNYINQSVISRMSDVRFEEGQTFGRTTAIKMMYYMDMWKRPDVLYTGYDSKTVEMLNEEGRGGGFVNSMVAVGLIGVFSMVLPFLYLLISSKEKKYALLFFIMIIMYMFNRTDVFWFCIVICIVYGLVIHEREQSFTRLR